MSKRVLEGVVVSNKAQKTVTVKVTRRLTHPTYKKIITRFKKYAAHDEQGACQIGDRVQIRECRPMSRTKRFEVIDIQKAGAAS